MHLMANQLTFTVLVSGLHKSELPPLTVKMAMAWKKKKKKGRRQIWEILCYWWIDDRLWWGWWSQNHVGILPGDFCAQRGEQSGWYSQDISFFFFFFEIVRSSRDPTLSPPAKIHPLQFSKLNFRAGRCKRRSNSARCQEHSSGCWIQYSFYLWFKSHYIFRIFWDTN